MKVGDRVRVELAGFGYVRAVDEERVSVTLDGHGWINVPADAVTEIGMQIGDEITELQTLKALPKGAIVAAGNAVNVAQGDGVFTLILHGTTELHEFAAWTLHRPCRLIHMPVPE